MFMLSLLCGVAVFLALAATRCFFRVEEGHVAVVTSFGAVARHADGTLRKFQPGLHAKLPWEKALSVCMKEQSLDLSGEEGGRSAMTADGTVLRFDSILRFVPMENELDKFLFGMKAPLEHVTGLFTCLLRNEIANFHASGSATGAGLASFGRDGLAPLDLSSAGVDAGSYSVIRRERQSLNERIEAFCRSQIGSRYGVRFAAVDLTDILPPDELATALNAVMQARVEAATLYSRAESESQQRIVNASRGVSLAEAQAAATRIEIEGVARHLEHLSRDGTLPAYVARRRAEVLSEARTHFVKRGDA